MGGFIGCGYIINFSSRKILLKVFIIPNGKNEKTFINGTSYVPLLLNFFEKLKIFELLKSFLIISFSISKLIFNFSLTSLFSTKNFSLKILPLG